MILSIHNFSEYKHLRIADTLWGTGSLPQNGDDYSQFLTEAVLSPQPALHIEGLGEMPYGDIPDDQGLGYIWTTDVQGNPQIVVVDHGKQRVYGAMTLLEDYTQGHLVYNRQFYTITYDVVDFLMFVFFQIRLLFTPGIVLHASAVEYNGSAVVFSAPSETGKSTQARLWEQRMGARMLNGDRPPITLRGDTVWAHGSPWTGSDPVIRNDAFPVAAIVMLQQSSTNTIRRLTAQEALLQMVPRCFMPYFDEKLMDRAMACIHGVICRTPVFLLGCRPDESAVQLVADQLSLLKG